MDKKTVNQQIINGLASKGINIAEIELNHLEAFADIMYKSINVIQCCTELPIIEELIISEIRRKQQKQVDDEIERFLNGNGTDCRLRGFFSEPNVNE